ncbi:MAG: hypothetical protein QM820_10100 [Minicystis sp.]
MRIAACLTALLLVLIPVAVVLAVRARRDRPLWAMALDVPLAVALDLLVVLALTRLFRLEIATFVSRALWLAAGGVLLSRKRRAGELVRPEALDRPTLRMVGLGAAIGLVISASCSWPYSIWDRKWHTPLTSSLRGQRLPFDNVFVKGEALHYHFTGDVYAAMVQSLSFGVLHSSLALSISHDILFLLIGASVVLFFHGLAGRRGALLGLAITFAALLAGPFTMGRDPKAFAIDGYSILNYLSMSFRPHDALAGLFYVGIVGAVLARVWRRPESPPLADTAPALIISVAGLAISDEASLGLLGLSIGITWLAYPDVVHPRRGPGVLVFVALLVALIGPNLAFAASLSPGAQHHAIKLVPWRSPGCYTPVLPLSTPEGRRMLFYDMLPTVAAWLGGIAAFVWQRRARSAPILVLLTTFVAVSVFTLTRVDVNGEALESHRFATSMLFLTPLLAAALLLRSPDEDAPVPASSSALTRIRRVAPTALVALGAALGAASTITWIAGVLPRRGHRHNHYFTTENLYLLDCKDLGGTLGATARPHYLSQSIWYAYAGCQPTFAPGKKENPWAITIGNPYFDKEALKVLHRSIPADESLPVICPRTPPTPADAVCAWAKSHAHCEDLGTRLTRCTLDAKERAAAMR